jgi:hypothetical protein
LASSITREETDTVNKKKRKKIEFPFAREEKEEGCSCFFYFNKRGQNLFDLSVNKLEELFSRFYATANDCF